MEEVEDEADAGKQEAGAAEGEVEEVARMGRMAEERTSRAGLRRRARTASRAKDVGNMTAGEETGVVRVRWARHDA